MGDNSAAIDNCCVYAGVWQHSGACAGQCAVIHILPFGNDFVDVLFKLPYADGEHLRREQCNHGEGVFSAPGNADFDCIFRAYQPCDTIYFYGSVLSLLCDHKSGRSSESVDFDDSACGASACDAQPWVRNHNFGTDDKVP